MCDTDFVRRMLHAPKSHLSTPVDGTAYQIAKIAKVHSHHNPKSVKFTMEEIYDTKKMEKFFNNNNEAILDSPCWEMWTKEKFETGIIVGLERISLRVDKDGLYQKHMVRW